MEGISMITASQLAGFFAARAVRVLSEGGTLIPILVRITIEGKRQMEYLNINDDIEASIAYGKKKLESNVMDAEDAVLVYGGSIPVGTEKVDAIIIQIRARFPPDAGAVLAVPYMPRSSGKFRVRKAKLLSRKNCQDFRVSVILKSFFEGVTSHQEGAKIWNDCLDESQ